jgi:hypothetical protein
MRRIVAGAVHLAYARAMRALARSAALAVALAALGGGLPAGAEAARRPITEQRFWSIVDDTRTRSGRSLPRQIRLLDRRLARLTPRQLIQFERRWQEMEVRAYRWDLWAACWVVDDGCGDDAFAYFRSYVVSLGRGPFERAVEDADTLVDVVSRRHARHRELVAYVPEAVYERKTGREMPLVGARLPDDPAGEAWEEHEAEQRVPRLAARFAQR